MPAEANALIYLRRQTAEIYPPKGSVPLKLEFPESAYNKLEITDKERMGEILTEFLGGYGIKSQRFLIVLADEVLFRRTVKVMGTEEESKSADEFYGEIPFNKDKMAGKVTRSGRDITFFAVNKGLFILIKSIIEKYRGRLEAVVPATVFGISGSDIVFTPESWKIFTQNPALILASDFLSDMSKDKQDFALLPDKTRKPTNKLRLIQTVVFGGLTVVLLLTIYLGLVWFLKSKNTDLAVLSPGPAVPATVTVSSPTVTRVISTTPTPSPTLTVTKVYAATGQITFNILNGSGITGLAGRVRDRLSSIGYLNLSLGNKDNYTKEETTVTFSSRVSPTDREQIIGELEGIIKTTAVSEDSGNPEVDVYVILGNRR